LYSIVTDACGNQVNSSRVITVTASPTATATPASQSICTGQATSIALSSSIGGTTYTWTVVQSGVSGASNGSGSSIAQTLTATGASSGTATYTITPTAGGCPGAPITVVITVNPLPVVSVSSTSICTGGSAVLTASGATTYTWSPAATLSASTGTSVTASPTTNTTYTIVGTTGTCNGTTTATVTVIAPPVVNVNSTTICSGTSAVLTATGATTYTWTPSASLSSGTGTSVTASPPTTTTYTITGTTGSFSSTLSGLTPGTTYNVRAFAIDGAGIAYGSNVSFTTSTSTSGTNFYSDRIYFKNGTNASEKYYLEDNSVPNITCSGSGTETAGTGAWNGRYLGSASPGAQLQLGAFLITKGKQNGNTPIINYRVYLTSSGPGVTPFTQVNMDFVTECDADGVPVSTNLDDKIWRNPLFNISTPSLPGNYTIEVYYERPGGDLLGVGGTVYLSNCSVNYKANIDIRAQDIFSDVIYYDNGEIIKT
jgi:hypothetical protein